MADWYDSEPPLSAVLIAELRRLKRRAQARWPLVVFIGVALTAAVVWKVARKPALYRARVVLAITEGDMAGRNDATPLHELHDYIGTVLLSNAEILKLIDELKIMESRRKKLGDEFVINSVRDQIGIAVWRNYFQYSYQYDERRTARVAVIYTDANRKFAYEMARRLTSIVIAREGEHRVAMAEALLEQSRGVLDAARARLQEAQRIQQDEVVALANAEASGDRSLIAVHQFRARELAAETARAEEAFFAIEQTTTGEALLAAVNAAGLALDMTVVDEREPPPAERTLVGLIAVGVVALCIFLPLAGIVIGSFDTRIHDLEDVDRLRLATLGHMPGFPGDRVGALRDRGVNLARMTSWMPWR